MNFWCILDEFFQPGCAAYPVKSSAPNCNFCFWSRCWIRHLKTNQNSRQLQNNFSFLAKLGEQRELLKCIQWYLWVRSRVTWLLCIRLIVEMLRKCFKDNQRVLKSVSSCPGNCFTLMEESVEKLPLLRRNLPFWYSGFSISNRLNPAKLCGHYGFY